MYKEIDQAIALPSLLNHNEVFEAADELLTLTESINDPRPQMTDILVELRAGNLELALALGKNTGPSQLTQDKMDSDDRRDNLSRRFRGFVELYLMDENTVRVDGAKVLHKILKQRRTNFELLSYVENSTELKLLFRSIDENPEAVTAIQTLELDGLYASLKQANSDFEALQLESDSEDVARQELPNRVAAARKVRFLSRVLLTSICFDAGIDLDGYEDLSSRTDELLTRFRSVAEARATRRENRRDQEQAEDQDQNSDQPASAEQTSEAHLDVDEAQDSGLNANTEQQVNPEDIAEIPATENATA